MSPFLTVNSERLELTYLTSTVASLPFCNTITFPGENVRDYWCNSLNISTPQIATTTYRGETGHSFSVLTLTDESSASLTLVTSGASSIAAGASITSGTTSASASASSGAGGDGDDDHKKKTPVGPIVGGVVGGVGAIALLGLALFFFLRKKKSKTPPPTDSTNTNHVPPPYNGPVMQQQPGNGPGGYNAVPQNQQQQPYYDPKHPYPSPGSQYVQPNSAVTGGFYPVQGHTPDNQTYPSSPTNTDPRMSVAPTSPSPSYGGYSVPGQQTPQHTGFQQQQQPGFQHQQQETIHEAPANTQDSHRGEMHELA